MSLAQTSCPQYCHLLFCSVCRSENFRIQQKQRGHQRKCLLLFLGILLFTHLFFFGKNQLLRTILQAIIIRELRGSLQIQNLCYRCATAPAPGPATINFVVPCRYMDICLDIYSHLSTIIIPPISTRDPVCA